MISPEYCVMQARFARWRNRQLLTAIAEIEASPRRKSLQPGPGSLMALCARQLWLDVTWLTRLDGSDKPGLDGLYADDHIDGWDVWRRDRQDMDARLHQWAARLTQPVLEGELFWFSAVDQRAVSRPMWLCVSHLFTTQTELRGQIFGQLSRLGVMIENGELIGLPHELDWM